MQKQINPATTIDLSVSLKDTLLYHKKDRATDPLF